MGNLWAGKQSFTVTIKGYENSTLSFIAIQGKTGATTLNVTPVKVAAKYAKLNLTFVNMETGKVMANTKIDVRGSIFTTNSQGQLPTIPVDAIGQTIKLGSHGFVSVDIKLDAKDGETINKTIKLAPIPCNEVITIKNSKTKELLANTDVNIGGINFKTNSKGEVTMSNMWAGDHQFTVKIKNFKNYNLEFTLAQGQTGHAEILVSPISK